MNARRSVSLLTVGLLASLVSGATAATRPSFVPSAVTAAGTHVVTSSVGDFNGDGKPDLAVANRAYHSKTAVVLLGRGDGTFVQPSAPVKLSETPERIMTADVNGDGNLDAVVRINDEPENNSSQHVSILLGNGAGALRPAPGSTVDFPELAAIADVNGDRTPDLVGFDGERIAVGLGDRTGHFVRAKSPSAGSRVAVADFNGDGRPDLVVGRQKNLSILLGTESGGFAPARKIGWAEGGLIVTDFNGDGKLDLAVAGKTLAILLGNGAGGFSGAPGSPVKEAFGTGIATGDFNGDGKTDVAVGREESVVTLLGDGTGRFHRAGGSLRLPFYPTVVGATDVNGDGKLDLVAGASVDRYSNEGPDARELRVAVLLQSRVTARRQVANRRPPRRAQGTQFRVRGVIVMFAADGDRAAVMATGGARGQCTFGAHVVVWDASTRRAANIDRVPAPQCSRSYSADSNVEEFALGGNSVAWITESYSGNTEGHHDIFAAKLPAGEVRHIADVFGREDYDASGSWAGHLRGGGSLLAYNEWSSACDGPGGYGCSSGDPWFGVTGATLFRIASARRVVARRGPGAYRLAAVGGRRLAVVAADGSVIVLAANGARVAAVPAKGDLMLSVSLSRTRLAVLRWSHTLDLYNARTGRLVRSLLLPIATPSDLAGVNAKLALLRRPGRLVLVRLTDGRAIVLKLARHLVGATLTERGLFYADNVPHAGGHIAFEPNAALLKRF